MPPFISKPCANLISRILVVDPVNRITIDQVCGVQSPVLPPLGGSVTKKMLGHSSHHLSFCDASRTHLFPPLLSQTRT